MRTTYLAGIVGFTVALYTYADRAQVALTLALPPNPNPSPTP